MTITNNLTSVDISWTAANVSGGDVRYNISIYMTDEDNPTAILCTDCTHITETHYTFTPDYLSPCHVYTFSVTPFNGAGQGESSPNITGHELKCILVYITVLESVVLCPSNYWSTLVFKPLSLQPQFMRSWPQVVMTSS